MLKSKIVTYEDYLTYERSLFSRKEWKHSHLELCRKRSRDWRRRNADQENLKLQRRREETRHLIIWLLGNKCKRCDFSNNFALQIDHVKGGGVRELKSLPYDVYLKLVLESIERGENKYQCLCANCNWIKKGTNHEVPRRLI